MPIAWTKVSTREDGKKTAPSALRWRRARPGERRHAAPGGERRLLGLGMEDKDPGEGERGPRRRVQTTTFNFNGSSKASGRRIGEVKFCEASWPSWSGASSSTWAQYRSRRPVDGGTGDADPGAYRSGPSTDAADAYIMEPARPAACAKRKPLPSPEDP